MKLKAILAYERVRAMIAGYQQAKRGEKFSERMEGEDVLLSLFAKFGEELIGSDEDVLTENADKWNSNPAKLTNRNALRMEMRKRLKEMIGEK